MAITAVTVEKTNNWRSWNISCLDTDTTTTFAHGMGASPGYPLQGPDAFWIQSLLAPVLPVPSGGIVLGAAAYYGSLAGSTVTNTGPSVINADVGVSPGTAVTGFPPGTALAILIPPLADQAKLDLTTAYNAAAAAGGAVTIATALGGQTLAPGVYSSLSGTFTLANGATVILDAGGNPNAVWIFQMATTLIAGNGATVSIINGGSAANVFWQVGSSATIGTTTAWQGTILALTSITLQTGATLNGRALARNGAVTMDTNTVNLPTGGGGGGGGAAISIWGMKVDATTVTLMKASAGGSGGAAPGVSIVAKAWVGRRNSRTR